MSNETDAMTAAESLEFREEDHRVEEHSASVKKELGLTDLVLTQILFIMGLSWVGE